MDTVNFLECLKKFTEEETKEMTFPTKPQKGETQPEYRAAKVYMMALPNSKTATKYVPYILHKKVTGEDIIGHERPNMSLITVRSIFCVYNENSEEGALSLLNLMEKMRIAMMKHPVLYKRARLYTGDEDASIQSVVYQEDIEPYFAGELVSVWEIPSIEQERQEYDSWTEYW